MSESTQASTSGDVSATSGAVKGESEETTSDPTSTSGGVVSTVPKAHAEKILKESKNKSLKIDELSAKVQELEDAKLTDDQKWQALAERRGEENTELKTKIQTWETTAEKDKKLNAVKRHLRAMGLKPEKEALVLEKLIDVSTLIIDPDTKAVLGAEELAKSFRQEHADLGVFGRQVPGVNQDAPRLDSGVTHSFEDKTKKEQWAEWVKLREQQTGG